MYHLKRTRIYNGRTWRLIIVAWSHSYVGCKPLKDILSERGESDTILDDIYTEVQQAAYEIINKRKQHIME